MREDLKKMVRNTLVVFVTVFVMSLLLAEMYQTLVVPIEKSGPQERQITSQAFSAGYFREENSKLRGKRCGILGS